RRPDIFGKQAAFLFRDGREAAGQLRILLQARRQYRPHVWGNVEVAAQRSLGTVAEQVFLFAIEGAGQLHQGARVGGHELRDVAPQGEAEGDVKPRLRILQFEGGGRIDVHPADEAALDLRRVSGKVAAGDAGRRAEFVRVAAELHDRPHGDLAPAVIA